MTEFETTKWEGGFGAQAIIMEKYEICSVYCKRTLRGHQYKSASTILEPTLHGTQ